MGDNIQDVYLKINNPIDISNAIDTYSLDDWRAIFKEAGVEKADEIKFSSDIEDLLQKWIVVFNYFINK